MDQLSCLIRKTSHDVLYQHYHYVLSFLMLTFNKTLFHRPPWCPESVTNADHSAVLSHNGVLQLWASITAHQGGQSPTSHGTTSEHPASFGRKQPWARLNQDSMAKAADVSHTIFISCLVRWATRALEILSSPLPNNPSSSGPLPKPLVF